MHYEEPFHFVPTVRAATHDVLANKPLSILLQAGRFFTFPKGRQGSLAEATGVPCMIGCIGESEIGIIAAGAFGCGHTELSLRQLGFWSAAQGKDCGGQSESKKAETLVQVVRVRRKRNRLEAPRNTHKSSQITLRCTVWFLSELWHLR